MRKALALLATACAAVAASVSIGVPVASANGACPSSQYSSISKLSGTFANSYSGTLRLQDADTDTANVETHIAVGGPTGGYFLRVFVVKNPTPKGYTPSFQVGVDTNNPGFSTQSSTVLFFFGPYNEVANYTISKDPAPATTWSATISDDTGSNTLQHVSLGGSPTWVSGETLIPSETPCQVFTSDITVSGNNLSTWTVGNSLGSGWYCTSFLNSNTTYRTYQCG